MKEKRITESELVLPSLYLMSLNPQGCIKTSELIPLLVQIFKPQGTDAKILKGRADSHFTQIVRNLKSHDTFMKNGFAEYKNGVYSITKKGREFVDKNRITLQYLLSSAFDGVDIYNSFGKVYKSRASIVIPYEEFVEEGKQIITKTKTYERSRKLRNAAIEHYSHNGIISCDCCGFEFKSFYGDTYGTSCIEIHHMKPIFQYASKTIVQTIDEALKNLLPVCPNCHRVIHKNNITAELIPVFKQQLSSENRIYRATTV